MQLAIFAIMFMAQADSQRQQNDSVSQVESVPPGPTPMAGDDGTLLVDLDNPCAATSLYVLLKLSGRATSFAEIQSKVGVEDSSGVPAETMCKTAAAFGLPLRVVRLRDSDLKRLSEPWICFFNPCDGLAKGTGHYAVARVVDDGTTVQIIDPPRSVQFVKRLDMFREDNPWECIALVPESGLSIHAWIFMAVGVLGVAAAVTLFRKLQ